VSVPRKYYKYQIFKGKCNLKVVIGEKTTPRGNVPVKATTKFISYINAQHEILTPIQHKNNYFLESQNGIKIIK
jgi:hypothetical protein